MSLSLLWDEHWYHSRSQIIHVNKNSVPYFCMYPSFSISYILLNIIYTVFILFFMFLNKSILADLMQGTHQGTWGESVTVCSWGCHFSFPKRTVKQNIWFGISAQSNFFCLVNQVHAWTFPPKQTVTSLEHCMVKSWWCNQFWLMTLMSTLKGWHGVMFQWYRGFWMMSFTSKQGYKKKIWEGWAAFLGSKFLVLGLSS